MVLYTAMAAADSKNPLPAESPPVDLDALLMQAEDLVHALVQRVLARVDDAPSPAIAERLREAARHAEALAAAHQRGECASPEARLALSSVAAWATDSTTLGGLWPNVEPTKRVALRQVFAALRDFIAISWTTWRTATRWAPGRFPIESEEGEMTEAEIVKEIAELSDVLVRPFGGRPVVVEAARLAFPLLVAQRWWRSTNADVGLGARRTWIAIAGVAAMFEAYEAELHSAGAPDGARTPTGSVDVIRQGLAGPPEVPPSPAVAGMLVASAAVALERRVNPGAVEPVRTDVPLVAVAIVRATQALHLAMKSWPKPTAPPRPEEEIRARLAVPWPIVHNSISAYLNLLSRAPPASSEETRRGVALRLGIYVGLMLQALPPYEP